MPRGLGLVTGHVSLPPTRACRGRGRPRSTWCVFVSRGGRVTETRWSSGGRPPPPPDPRGRADDDDERRRVGLVGCSRGGSVMASVVAAAPDHDSPTPFLPPRGNPLRVWARCDGGGGRMDARHLLPDECDGRGGGHQRWGGGVRHLRVCSLPRHCPPRARPVRVRGAGGAAR